MKTILITAVALAIAIVSVPPARAEFIVNFEINQLSATTFNVTATDASTTTDYGIRDYFLDLSGGASSGLTFVAKTNLVAVTEYSPDTVGDLGSPTVPGDGNEHAGPSIGFDVNLSQSSGNLRQISQSQGGGNGAQFNLYGVGKVAAPYPILTGASYVSPDTGGTNYYYSVTGSMPVYTKATNVNMTTANVIIGAGTFLPGTFNPAKWFISAAASVYDRGTNSNSSAAASTNVDLFGFDFGPFKFALDNTGNAVGAVGGNVSGGSTTVMGSSQGYFDPFATIARPNSAKGFVDITNSSLGLGAEVPVYVLVSFDLSGSEASLEQLRQHLFNTGGADNSALVGGATSDTALTELLSIYNGAGFTSSNSLLFEYTTAPRTTSGDLDFGFDLTGSGVTVTGVVGVPEPTSLSLLALGALSLYRRKRR